MVSYMMCSKSMLTKFPKMIMLMSGRILEYFTNILKANLSLKYMSKESTSEERFRNLNKMETMVVNPRKNLR
jgi:hypothetical protein